MVLAQFPNLERHKQGRSHFIDEPRSLQTHHKNNSVSVAAQLSTVLRDWLSLHSRSSDKESQAFLTHH